MRVIVMGVGGNYILKVREDFTPFVRSIREGRYGPVYVYYVFVLIRIVTFLEKYAVLIRPFE
jgi:hypothetical protein